VRVLLDTCVLSELRRPDGSAAVRRNVNAIESKNLFICAITVGEIAYGVALLADGARKRELGRWLLTIECNYADQILSIDLEVSRIWGELAAAARKLGKQVAAPDGLIAATALRHGLHLMTRNVADFKETGAMLIDPWDDTDV
jgi:toxin FitB